MSVDVAAIDSAVHDRCPVIGLWQSGGAKLADGGVLIEREAELRALNDLLADDTDGCRIAAIRGVTGSGKTALLNAFAARAASQGVPVFPLATQHLDSLPAADRSLIAVDDAHDVDPAALKRLLDSARHRTSNTLLVLTEPDHVGQCAPLLPDSAEATRHFHLAPLSGVGVELMVAHELGPRAAAASYQTAYALSGGNPRLLSALIHDTRAAYADVHPARLRLTPGDAFKHAILACLAGASPDTARVAHALAVLDCGDSPKLVERLARVGSEPAAKAFHELAAIGLVAGGDYRDPRIRTAVLAGLSDDRRSALHLAAARLLRDTGAPIPVVARHLLEGSAEGDTWAARTLTAAARQTLDEGRRGLAVAYLECAERAARQDRERFAAMILLAQTAWHSNPAMAAAYAEPLTTALRKGLVARKYAPFISELAHWTEAPTPTRRIGAFAQSASLA
jgi:AAA ATPase domain